MDQPLRPASSQTRWLLDPTASGLFQVRDQVASPAPTAVGGFQKDQVGGLAATAVGGFKKIK